MLGEEHDEGEQHHEEYTQEVYAYVSVDTAPKEEVRLVFDPTVLEFQPPLRCPEGRVMYGCVCRCRKKR